MISFSGSQTMVCFPLEVHGLPLVVCREIDECLVVLFFFFYFFGKKAELRNFSEVMASDWKTQQGWVGGGGGGVGVKAPDI